jgi:hypothetical protein
MIQLRALAIVLALVAAICFTRPATAQYPPYKILQTPPSGCRQASLGNNSGIGQGVSAPAYSYGYFGVAPRKHGSRHHGYYNNYSEWSYR